MTDKCKCKYINDKLIGLCLRCASREIESVSKRDKSLISKIEKMKKEQIYAGEVSVYNSALDDVIKEINDK